MSCRIKLIAFCWLTFSITHSLWATTFTWDPSPDPRVTGYNFYQDKIKIGSTNSLLFTEKNLIGGEAHSYYVTAFAGTIESVPSKKPLTLSSADELRFK